MSAAGRPVRTVWSSAPKIAQLSGRPNIRAKARMRLRVVGPQQPRRRRVAEGIALTLEHAVRGEEAQDAAERVGVGADRRRELGGGAGRLVQRVGDAEVGDDVQAARQAVAARDLYHCRNGLGSIIGIPP